MKLTQLPNFRVEDFPSEQSWIGKLFTQLNPLIQALNQILDLNIEFGSNIKSLTKEYTLTSFQTFGIAWPYKNNPPADLRITKAQKGTQLSACILLPAWSFDSTTQTITVSNVLEAASSGVSELSGTYKFTVRVSV